MALGGSPPGGGARHKTVVGQFAVDPSAGQQTKTIGRSNDCDIVVAHPQVSSRHALLHQVGSELFIEDKGSQNGTFVRGQRIQGFVQEQQLGISAALSQHADRDLLRSDGHRPGQLFCNT